MPTPPLKPHYSLWLLPPKNSPLLEPLTQLTSKTLPPTFPGFTPKFQPHITLCSQIPVEPNPTLPKLPDNIPKPKIHLRKIVTGGTFFTRVVIQVDKTDSLVELARLSREKLVSPDGIEDWVEKYWPHLSLAYNETEVDEKELDRVRGLVKDAGVQIGGEGEMAEWVGGRIALVETYKEVETWTITEEREL